MRIKLIPAAAFSAGIHRRTAPTLPRLRGCGGRRESPNDVVHSFPNELLLVRTEFRRRGEVIEKGVEAFWEVYQLSRCSSVPNER